MDYDYKTLFDITYDLKQAQAELKKVIKSLQKDSKISLRVELSNKEAVSAIISSNKELNKMAQYYKNLQTEQKRLTSLTSASLKEQLSEINQLSDAFENYKQSLGNVDFSQVVTSLDQLKSQTKDIEDDSTAIGQTIKESTEDFGKSLISGAISKGVDIMMGLATGTAEVASAAEGATVATTMLGAAMDLLPFVAIGAGIVALVNVLDMAITTTSELEEKVEETGSAYETAISNLETITTELETQNALLDELLVKTNLTYVEKSQLDNLKEVTQELQIQKDLAEKEVARTQKDAAESSAKYITKKYDIDEFSSSKIDEYVNNAESSGNNAILTNDKNDLASMIAGYKQFTKLQNEASNTEDYEHYNVLTSEISDSIWESTSALEEQKIQMQGYYDTIEKTEQSGGILTDDQKKVKEAYEQTSNAIEIIYKELDPEKFKIFQFNSLLNDDSFSDVKIQLENLAKSGKLSASVLTNNEKYKSLLDKTGISASDAVKEIEALAGSNNNLSTAEQQVSSTFTVNKENLSTYISGLKEVSNLQKTVNDELKSGNISNSTLVSLLEKYPEMESQITNYQSGVEGSQQELVNKLDECYQNDLNNYGEYLIAKNENNQAFFESTFSSNASLVNDFNKNYGVDLSNVTSYAQAKFEIENQLFSSVANMWSDYYDAQTNSFSEKFMQMGMRLGSLKPGSDEYKALEEKYNEGQAIINKIIKAKNDLDNAAANNYKPDLLDTSTPSSTESTTEIDWISRKIEVLSSKLDKLKTKISDTFATFKTRSNNIDIAQEKVQKEIRIYQKSYKSYMDKANEIDLPEDLKLKVQNGSYDITEYDSKTAEKINSYQDLYDKAQALKDTIRELKEEEKDYSEQKIDLIQTRFDSKTDYIDSLISKREAEMGDNATSKDYEYIEKKQRRKLELLTMERDQIQEQFESMNLKVGSEEWLYYKKLLSDLGVEIEENEENIHDTINLAANAKLAAFDKLLETLNEADEKLSHISSLISGDSFQDGTITAAGLTNQYLNLQGLANANSEIAYYQDAIANLKRSDFYDDDKGLEAYNEKLEEYQEGLESAQSSAKSFRDAIIDLVKEGIEAETEAMRDYIDVQKEALESEKSLNDYQKTVEEKTKNISILQRKINELSQSSNRKDIALRLELQKDLADAESDLEVTKADHNLEVKESALDDELEAFEKVQDKKIQLLESDLATQEAAISDSLNLVKNNYSTIYSEIDDMSKTYGTSIKDNLVLPTIEALDDLETRLSDSVNNVESISTTGASNTKNTNILSLLTNGTGTGNATDSLTKYLQTHGYTALSRKQMVELAKLLGVSGIDDVSDVAGDDNQNRDLILNALKAYLSDTSSTTTTSNDNSSPATTSKDTQKLSLAAASFSNNELLNTNSMSNKLLNAEGEKVAGIVKLEEAFVRNVNQSNLSEIFAAQSPKLESYTSLKSYTDTISSFTAMPSVQINSPLISVAGVARDDINNQIYSAMEKIPDIVGNAVYSQLKR